MKPKKLLSILSPPPEWRIRVLVTLGVLAGLVLVILHIANATSYLSDNPKACMNCHVMSPQYASWQRGSHARVATCNDCHVPHDNVIRKYFFKASDGLRHSTMFTFKLEPEVIHIKSAGINVVEENCIRCHQSFLHQSSLSDLRGDDGIEKKEKLCWDCHRETPHGRVSSLSSVPFVRVPQQTPVMPEWIEKLIYQENK